MQEKPDNNEIEFSRTKMIRSDLKGRGINEPDVLKALSEVPRQEFVPADYKSQSYKDGPLPIGFGQTISQPYIVALMTQKLRINSNCNVLEIGTGSGYQTAVLSRLAIKVFTIERISELSESARAILIQLGYNNIEFHIGDGSLGWPEDKLPEKGRFDRIIITAAVPEVPQRLMEQLCEGGFLIAPVGFSDVQELIIFEKTDAEIIEEKICDVRFVRLFGKYGF